MLPRVKRRSIALFLSALVAVALPAALARAEPGTLTNLPPSMLPPPKLLDRAPRVAARMAVLDRGLAALGRRGEGRLLSGFLQLGAGAVLVGIGAAVRNEIGRSLLLVVGAGSLARGTVQLTLVPDAPQRARAYAALPAYTPDHVRARIAFGEAALAELARGARKARIVDGSITMAIASSYVPLLWWLQRREDPTYRFGDDAFDYVSLALSGINFATGLVGAIAKSEAEERQDAYRALKEQLEREEPGALEKLTFGLGTEGKRGIGLRARVRF